MVNKNEYVKFNKWPNQSQSRSAFLHWYIHWYIHWYTFEYSALYPPLITWKCNWRYFYWPLQRTEYIGGRSIVWKVLSTEVLWYLANDCATWLAHSELRQTHHWVAVGWGSQAIWLGGQQCDSIHPSICEDFSVIRSWKLYAILSPTRPDFWATVCKTVRPMLSVRCPVCHVLSISLSVTFVHCG